MVKHGWMRRRLIAIVKTILFVLTADYDYDEDYDYEKTSFYGRGYSGAPNDSE